jgi:hypothetical protein
MTQKDYKNRDYAYCMAGFHDQEARRVTDKTLAGLHKLAQGLMEREAWRLLQKELNSKAVA